MALKQSETGSRLPLHMPAAESETVESEYTHANVILEYGSGGSTMLGASMPGKKVFSVESDPDWAKYMQTELNRNVLPSPAKLYYTDIGATGRWGCPLDDREWPKFHHYPLAIWDEPFFEHPDVVLIDGRFRAACFVTVFLRTPQPVTVLFDDYTVRPKYHVVEKFAKPDRYVGRMAVFHLGPSKEKMKIDTFIIGLFSQVSYAKVLSSKNGESPPRARYQELQSEIENTTKMAKYYEERAQRLEGQLDRERRRWLPQYIRKRISLNALRRFCF